jgi:hypothetical protein
VTNIAVNALALSLGVFLGLLWQSIRVRKEAEREAAFRRHLRDISRVSGQR